MSRLGAFRSAVAKDFLEADTRWLAVFRLVFGTYLVGYAIHVTRFGRLDRYFTDLGLFPTDLLRLFYPVHHDFTLFRFAHTHEQAVGVFALTLIVYAAFALGIFTRITAPLAFLATVSLHHRVPMIVNGAMLVTIQLLLWSMFLPLGRHASFDAWLARRRGRELPPLRVRSLAMLAVRLQLAAVYLFNVLHKGGHTWTSGQAVHLVLWQQRAVLPFAKLIREHEPAWFSPVATYGTFFVESLLVLLVLLPVARTGARRLAAATMLAFHWGLQSMLNLGPFPWVFSMAALLLLTSEDGSIVAWVVGPSGTAAEESAHVARAPRIARETAIAIMLVHALLLGWIGNPALRVAFGPARPMPMVSAIGERLYLVQAWSLFAPDAPTRDLVLMPVVTLRDGRVLDARRRRPPDFRLLDGRLLETDFFQQTYDPVAVIHHDARWWHAYGEYLRCVPTLERWAGERRVDAVAIHHLEIERPPYGVRPTVEGTSQVPFMQSYADEPTPRCSAE